MGTYDWELMESFGEAKPSWQYTSRAITAMSSAKVALGAYLKNELVGYVIFTPSTKRIQQIAVKPAYRRQGIASQLLGNILHEYGDTLFVINVDKSANALNAFFTKMGLSLQLKQFEMELLL
ncbi:MAG: GNAT family N-acetyltransferase [Bacteroidota bacterium]